MAAQLMLSLSILVVLHEMGHFAPARWFGCRVEKFYLFFDPYFSLFKKQIGETEWGIGWLPLGGYVKISGMVDESLDTEQLDGPPQPWEFRSKPAWQRLVIMLGGVTVNFILGFAVFAGMLMYWGRTSLPTENAVHGIYADSLGQVYGLRTGDRVLAVDTLTLDKFGDQFVKSEILLRGARTISVERGGQTVAIALPDSLQRKLTSERYQRLSVYSLPLRPVIDTIIDNTPAAASGLRKGDLVVAVDGTPVTWLQDITALLDATTADEVEVTVRRDRERVPVIVGLTAKRRMGFTADPNLQYNFVAEDFSLAEAVPAGIEEGWSQITGQIAAFGQIFAGNIDARESVGSVFSIGKAFGGTWNWYRFWRLTGLLSLILAIMNLLPIPALDGGHVMFLLYEVVTGRKPGDKFLQVATTGGAIFLIAFMLLALLNDISKLL